MKMVRLFAPKLLHRHLSGRTRNLIDKPAQWLVGLVGDESFTMDQVLAVVRIAVVRARQRAKLEGGRREQYKRIGIVRQSAEDTLLSEKARTSAKAQESTLPAQQIQPSSLLLSWHITVRVSSLTEIEELRKLHRVEWLSEVEGFGTKQLIQQINIFRFIDKVNVRMKETARKLGQVRFRRLSVSTIFAFTRTSIVSPISNAATLTFDAANSSRRWQT